MLPPSEKFFGGLFRPSPNMLPFTRSTRSPLSLAVTRDPTTTSAAITRPRHHITSNTTISPTSSPPSRLYHRHPHHPVVTVITTIPQPRHQQPPSRPPTKGALAEKGALGSDNITKGMFVSAATTTHKGAWGVGSNHQQRVRLV
ncbi:hypothetical protein Tco_1176815 [Tanacetum coccineum]